MSKLTHRPWATAVLVLTMAQQSLGQVAACQTGVAFPAPAIEMPLGSGNTASDMYLAVSPHRIVLTTNVRAQLRCRSGGGTLSGTSTIPLREADLASGLFVTDPPEDYDDPGSGDEIRRRVFDPRVIYDNYDQRFWLVASEDDYGSVPYNIVGRIHLAVSRDPPQGIGGSKSSPNSWTGDHWIKCTHGQGANKPPIDLQTDLGFPATFPDRCSIAVDKDHVFISYRESPLEGVQSPTVFLVLAKANVLHPSDPIVPLAVIRTDQPNTHELARDYAIAAIADPGVHVVSIGEADANDIFNNLRFGRLGLNEDDEWAYEWSDIGLSSFAHQKSCGGSVPGGEYRTGNTCATVHEDENHSNGVIWSCVTRPDQNGVRKVWAVHAVRPVGEDCPRVLQWYEIDPATGLLTTQRYALPDGDWAHDPSIAVNANGVKVITFNRSYADTIKYPGVWRLTVPPNGSWSLTEEKAGPALVYKPFVGDDESTYWADFSGTEPDPVVDCQFWALHMTVHNNPVDPPCNTISGQWRAWLFRFRFVCSGSSMAMHENLDMDQDGELTEDDIAIYSELAAGGDPEMDRTYEGETDVWDFLDFMTEWDDPE